MESQLKIEREKTKRLELEQLVSLLKEPLLQLLIVYLIVEYFQRYHQFGQLAGTAVEAAAMSRSINMEKIIGYMADTAKAVAPVAGAALMAIPK